MDETHSCLHMFHIHHHCSLPILCWSSEKDKLSGYCNLQGSLINASVLLGIQRSFVFFYFVKVMQSEKAFWYWRFSAQPEKTCLEFANQTAKRGKAFWAVGGQKMIRLVIHSVSFHWAQPTTWKLYSPYHYGVCVGSQKGLQWTE